jgi:hypothetical protein
MGVTSHHQHLVDSRQLLGHCHHVGPTGVHHPGHDRSTTQRRGNRTNPVDHEMPFAAGRALAADTGSVQCPRERWQRTEQDEHLLRLGQPATAH